MLYEDTFTVETKKTVAFIVGCGTYGLVVISKCSKSTLRDRFGQKYLGLIRELKSAGLNVQKDIDKKTKEPVYYIIENQTSDEDYDAFYDEFDEILIKYCVSSLLKKHGFEVIGDSIQYEENTGRLIIDNFYPEDGDQTDCHVLLLEGQINCKFGNIDVQLLNGLNDCKSPEEIVISKIAEEFS